MININLPLLYTKPKINCGGLKSLGHGYKMNMCQRLYLVH